MLSELHSLNLKLCSKQYNKKFVLHLIVAPQLSSGRQHNCSTKTRQAGRVNEQSMYSLMSMLNNHYSSRKSWVRKILMSVWLNLKIINFCQIILATDFYCQWRYLLGENAHSIKRLYLVCLLGCKLLFLCCHLESFLTLWFSIISVKQKLFIKSQKIIKCARHIELWAKKVNKTLNTTYLKTTVITLTNVKVS